MNGEKDKRIKKVLGKYNYWRQVLKLSFQSKRKLAGEPSCGCRVACASDPCQADPTCDFD